MGFLRLFLNVLLLVGLIFGVHGQKCGRYSQDDGICANYISNDDYVIYNEGKNLNLTNSLDSLAIAQGLSTLRDIDLFLENCTQAFTSFVCATAFPKCKADTQEVIPPCLSTCENAIKRCRNNLESAPEDTQGIIWKLIISSPLFPKDCAGNIPISPPLNIEYPTENCNSSPKLSNKPKCFSPLVEDSKWMETNKSEKFNEKFCDRGCCLPCPQSFAFYPSKQMERGFLATQIFRALSAIGSGIMLALYMVLPGKRTHPSTLILYTSLSIFMYSFNVFFSIFDPKKVQCSNEVDPSTQGNNRFFCGFQGTLLIFSAHATAIWIGFIILNLHIHTVWNSNILKDKYKYINVVAWGVPTILTIIPLAKQSVRYEFATLCFIKVEDSDGMFFYPLAFVIIPSFFIHMSTFVYIYRISKKDEESKESEFMTNRLHVLQAIKIQWRALLLAIILIVTIIFYWLFYFVELSKLAHGGQDAKFLTEWTSCIQQGKGQDYCSNTVSSKYMPSFGLMISAEITASLIGVHLIIIFFNKALWHECKQWINARYNPREIEFLAI